MDDESNQMWITHVCNTGLVKKYRGAGGLAGAFQNVVVRKHMTHPSIWHKTE